MMYQVNPYLSFKEYMKNKIREDLSELDNQEQALNNWLDDNFIDKIDYEKRIEDIRYSRFIINNHLEKLQKLRKNDK